jgi:hypothetical protein
VAKADFVKRIAARAYSALASASPAVKEKALDYMSKATSGKVNSVTAVEAYGAQNKGTVALVSQAVVAAGIDPRNIFTNDVIGGMRDEQLLKLRDSMMASFGQVYGPVDAKSAYQATNNADRSRERLLAGAVARARDFFGGQSMGDKQLQSLHVSLKMFLECSEAELASLLADRSAHLV